jgi:transcriptional regulator with XRE-family HTH domain
MGTTASGGIGVRVRSARERLGWNREALAFHSGVSWSAVAQVESGRRTNLRPATLAALARALGVTIDYLVSGRSSGSVMLNHCALPYASDEEFVRVAGPFVEDAIARSEPVLVVTTKPNRNRLAKWLAPNAGDVEFAERAKWYQTPASTLKRYAAFLNAKLDAGAPWVRIVAEPVWPAGSASDIQTWTRYESLVNLVFSAAPTTILCPYDTRSLDPEVIRLAYVTHPQTIAHGNPAESSDYMDPSDFLLD